MAAGLPFKLALGILVMIQSPPPVLVNARVLEYALVDESIRFTGRLMLYIGGERLGAVPALAICQEFSGGNLLLVHCNEHWGVEGVQAWNAPDVPAVTSVDEIKARAERYYSGISAKWIRHHATQEEAEAYWEDSQRIMACSFCGKSPLELGAIIEGRGVRICEECIRVFYDEINANEG